jgi:hypothetical protein
MFNMIALIDEYGRRERQQILVICIGVERVEEDRCPVVGHLIGSGIGVPQVQLSPREQRSVPSTDWPGGMPRDKKVIAKRLIKAIVYRSTTEFIRDAVGFALIDERATTGIVRHVLILRADVLVFAKSVGER